MTDTTRSSAVSSSSSGIAAPVRKYGTVEAPTINGAGASSVSIVNETKKKKKNSSRRESEQVHENEMSETVCKGGDTLRGKGVSSTHENITGSELNDQNIRPGSNSNNNNTGEGKVHLSITQQQQLLNSKRHQGRRLSPHPNSAAINCAVSTFTTRLSGVVLRISLSGCNRRTHLSAMG